jgi:ribosomal protein S18 acetylase RimI-like enzyme
VEHARSASADDVADLVELARHLRAELGAHRGGELWATHDVAGEPIEAELTRAMAAPDTLVVVGAIDDVTVGYGIVTVVDLRDGTRLGRVSELFVEPEARSVGVGEAIALAVLNHCREAGCRGVDVVALPGHRAAKNFFEEQGFTARALVMHHALEDPATSDDRAPDIES